MFHKGLPKNSKSQGTIQLNLLMGEQSYCYLQQHKSTVTPPVGSPYRTIPSETNLLLSFAGFILYLSLELRLRFKTLIFEKAAVFLLKPPGTGSGLCSLQSFLRVSPDLPHAFSKHLSPQSVLYYVWCSKNEISDTLFWHERRDWIKKEWKDP